MAETTASAGGMMRTLRVRRVEAHTPLLASLFFERTFDAEPGQFVQLWIPGVDEKPFSISDLSESELEVTVKAIGPFTRRLVEAKAGDWIGVRGPFGTRFRVASGAVLVGGGIGYAPLRFLERRLRERSLPYRLVVGVRSVSDLPFREELAGRATLASDDGSIGVKGTVLEPLRSGALDGAATLIQAAGPEPMLLAVRRLAEERAVDYELSLERYMKCGVGICGQCCLDGSGLRLCVEGPVVGPRELEGATDLGLPHRRASGRRG